MRATSPTYTATVAAGLVLGLSYVVLGGVLVGMVPATGIWQLLGAPAWLTLMAGMVLNTTTGIPAIGVIGIPLGAVALLLPFVAIDRLRGRTRERAAIG